AQGVDPTPPVFTSAPDPRGIATRHVFDRLVEYDRRSGRIVPGLATWWEVLDNGTTYTFHLRRNVSFHAAPGFTPTRYFNADDVLFTFARLMQDDHIFHKLPGSGTDDYGKVGMPELLGVISKDAEDVITFNLAVPYPKFLANMSMDFASIQSAEYATAMTKAGTPDLFAVHPIGTGAFRVETVGKDGVLYTANPQYWGDILPEKTRPTLERQVVPPSIMGID
ncbi:MAG: hypothetical protein JXQ84_06880, partial [Rhodospirillaceae bacterium]|nr:hypothetical protein [Rhodospirillaceae bacterium]